MATTVSHGSPLGSTAGPASVTPQSEGIVHQIRQMDSVRQFAAQLTIGPNGQALTDLPDEEWESLLSSVGDSDSEELAIARVIQQAHRSGRAASAIDRGNISHLCPYGVRTIGRFRWHTTAAFATDIACSGAMVRCRAA